MGTPKKIKQQNIQNRPSCRGTVGVKLLWKVRLQIIVAFLAVVLALVLLFAMTTAWYTNVAKTSSLTFQTQSWGFDPEKISVQADAAAIYPGASGTIGLSVDNSERSDGARIQVSLDKSQMEEALQKRIYFYQDKAETYHFGPEEQEETTERTYISAAVGRDAWYTLLPGEVLTLSEDYCSDAPVCWEWVNDLVGYYFYGSIVQTEQDGAQAVTAEEYIRPITYDYDRAVFDLDPESGSYQQLLSVGEQSRDELLYQISVSDGFEGTIGQISQDEGEAALVPCDPVVIPGETASGSRFYYPVAVEADGSGVWAYLCRFDEVEASILEDTAYDQDPDKIQGMAVIDLTASVLSGETAVASDETELRAAMDDPMTDVVVLQNDIYLKSGIEVSRQDGIVLDLNQYAIHYEGAESEYCLFTVQNSSLTILNGAITRNGSGGSAGTTQSKAVESFGGAVTLSNVTVSAFDSAVVTSDMSCAEPGDSRVRIFNCTLEALQTAVLLQGNGSVTQAETSVIIEESRIIGQGYIGISGQGTNNEGDQRWGTELVVRNSKIEGQWTAIYQPQQKAVTRLLDCTLTGYTGIAVKGGTMTLSGCTVSGTGNYSAAKPSGGGWTDTGDGIYVEATYPWGTTVVLENKCHVTSEFAYALELFGQEGNGPGRMIAEAGTYTGDLGASNWNRIGTFEIYDSMPLSEP